MFGPSRTEPPRCPQEHPTEYQPFSAGAEVYCPDCDEVWLTRHLEALRDA